MKKIVFLFLLIPSLSYAGSAHLLMPREKTVEACQLRLGIDGRVIAEMKWNLKFDVTKAHEQFQPPDGTPQWFIETVKSWIDSVYKWNGTPVDWFDHEWKGCEDPI